MRISRELDEAVALLDLVLMLLQVLNMTSVNISINIQNSAFNLAYP